MRGIKYNRAIMKRPLMCAASAALVFALGVALVRLGSRSTVVVTWETVSEVDTAGFLLYRGEVPDGPFHLLVQTPIPAMGDPLVGASYRYEDREVVWGQRYFYQLEEVERSGTLSRLDRVVDGRAGAGWLWAVATGALVTVVAALSFRYVGNIGGRNALEETGDPAASSVAS